MKALAFEFAGGLDEESSDLEITPGTVRRSLNYEALPNGGYRRIDGWVMWSGSEATSNLLGKDIQFIETESLPVIEVLHQYGFEYTSVLGVRLTVLGYIPIYEGNLANLMVIGYYCAIRLVNQNDRLRKGDVLQSFGTIASNVLNTNVVLSSEDYTRMIDAIYSGPILSNVPEGTGRVHKLIDLDGRIYAIREDGAGVKLSVATPTFGKGQWQPRSDTIPMGNSDHWDHEIYHFGGRNNEFFLVNGEDHVVYVREGTSNQNAVIDLTAAPLNLSATGPAPSYVIVFKEHLFLAIGSSIIHSNIGNPMVFDAATGGAGEIRIGGEITGMEILPGNALAVFTEQTIDILYGTSSIDWRLERYSREVGAIRGTIQQLPTTIFWDRRGIQLLEQTDAYGDFTSNTLSHGYYDLFERMKADQLFTFVNRAKSEYRVLNKSGRGIYLTFNNKKLVGAMEVDLKLDSPISCVAVKKNVDDADHNLVGLEDGRVILLDFGPSFNGDPIHSSMHLSFMHGKSPMQKKRWRWLQLHMTGDPRTQLEGRGEMEYGQDFHHDNRIVDLTIEASKQVREVNSTDDFVWDHDARIEGRMYLEGTSTSIGLVLKQETNNVFSHTIHHGVVSYSDRGILR